MLRTVAGLRDRAPRPWTGSWTEPSVQPVRSGPSAARLRGIRAASACDARGRTSHNPPVVGSSPTRPTSWFDTRARRAVDRIVYRCRREPYQTVGRIRSHRVTLGWSLARQDLRWETRAPAGRSGPADIGTERAAQIEFGRLLAQAAAGRQPDSASPWPSCSTSTCRQLLVCVDPEEQPRALASGSPQSRTGSLVTQWLQA